MDHEEFMRMLDEYTVLSGEQIAELERHAAVCENCRAELEFFKAINETTASMPFPSPPPDLSDKINERIDREPPRHAAVIDNIKRNMRHYATAAACIAVGLVVGVNGHMLTERLTGGDGVISSVTETTESGENSVSEGTENAAAPAPSALPGEPEAAPENAADAAPVTAAPVRTTRPSAAADTVTSAPKAEKTTQSPQRASAKSTVSGSVPAAEKPLPRSSEPAAVPTQANTEIPAQTAEPPAPVTEPAKTEATAAAPTVQPEPEVQSETAYTIPSEEYYMPDTTESADTETAEDEAGVENYALAQDRGSDYGYSDGTVPDQLAVDHEYADTVAEILSGFNMRSDANACILSFDEFESLLAKLAFEGVPYRYIPRGGSGDEVIFRLVLM